MKNLFFRGKCHQNGGVSMFVCLPEGSITGSSFTHYPNGFHSWKFSQFLPAPWHLVFLLYRGDHLKHVDVFFCNKHVWNREKLWKSKQPEMLLTHLTWRWWINKFKNGFLKYETLDPTWRARQIKGGGLRNSIKTIRPLAGNTNKGTNCIKGPGCALMEAFHVPRKLAERHALGN